MSRIRLLDEQTVNRIAAGEVVERPASAVKELVENAIDSGAARIAVRLEEGGKRLIEVSDDGCGMTEEEAVLALQRHATSKLRTEEDLSRIVTLGFRGEALPSIASVSSFTLTTRARGAEAGTRVRVEGGEIRSVETTGCAEGTTVRVEDLFLHTPARLKFLKSAATELSRAADAVGRLAVAHPFIAFRLVSGREELLLAPGNGDLLETLAAVWGRETAKGMIEVRGEPGETFARGYVGRPGLSRPGRSHEWFFANGRPVQSRLLGHAAEEALRALTPAGRFPVAALFVETDPALLDVNVHPAKAEVRFVREGEAHRAVTRAVRQALEAGGLTPELSGSLLAGGEAQAPPLVAEAALQPAFGGYAFERLSRAAALSRSADPPAYAASPVSPPGPEPLSEQLRGFRVLGQLEQSFIVAATDRGLAIVDQHVAHERVLFEKLTRARSQQGVPSQALAVPETLEIGAAEAALLRARLASFSEAGWEIEPFGRDSFLVRATPAYARRKGAAALLRDMVDELAHQSVSRRLLVERDHVTITNACKLAVKAGDPLTHAEMTALLEQLCETENPYFCPHGRPIVVTLPSQEIARRFGR